jgi:hypothetical protein
MGRGSPVRPVIIEKAGEDPFFLPCFWVDDLRGDEGHKHERQGQMALPLKNKFSDSLLGTPDAIIRDIVFDKCIVQGNRSTLIKDSAAGYANTDALSNLT